jgi:hypothetical protein
MPLSPSMNLVQLPAAAAVVLHAGGQTVSGQWRQFRAGPGIDQCRHPCPFNHQRKFTTAEIKRITQITL